MSKYSQGTYQLLNPEKYIGSHSPIYRSSWEMTMMRFLDNHPGVINWGSECVRIPYRNPFTGKNSTYFPDFLVMYQDKTGKKISEIIEIKPKNQASLMEARTQQEKAAVVLNMAKWQAAEAYCKKLGLHFRIVTEQDIFNRYGEKKKR